MEASIGFRKKMPKDLFSVHALFKSSLDFCGTNTRVFSIIVTACVYSGKIRKAVEVVFCNQWLEFFLRPENLTA